MDKMDKIYTITIRLTPVDYHRLMSFAERNGVTKSVVIRAALTRLIDESNGKS